MAGQSPGTDGLRGRIAVVSSVAAFVAAPGAPTYCATKAAVQRWAEALDATERKRGIRMHAICPGYVRTPMTARNKFPMPFLMDADEAARRTLAGMARGKTRIAYPWPTYMLARFAGSLPISWRAAIFSRLPTKDGNI
jgi:short-subunit dehydrogenase